MNTPKTETPAAIVPPRIELRKFKHAEFASEETNCYQAEVWIDGRPAFHAHNDGHGGPDFYQPIRHGETDRATFDAVMKRLEAYAATIPPRESHGMMLEQTVEGLIGEAVEEKLAEKDRAKYVRKMTKEILFLRGGKLWQSKIPPSHQPVTEATVRTWQSHNARPGDEVLNLLPADQAWAKIKAAVYI